MSSRPLLRLSLALLSVVALPGVAQACPVCFDAQGSARVAYFNTTILLSLLPLAFMGAIALYIRARLRAQETEDITGAVALPQETL